ncbi:hypothetical protein BCF53_106115 [Reinekea marinisedimentorum]|uniref:ATP-grasp domain-containing protein n=2 Tax=Reinekea marinisedimentorum TaxID=230495 RepID=A0A4R3I7Y8_9GAMM|nr:hypothetical protein BCF53_106115 [Reinekea marinisedimentorum]
MQSQKLTPQQCYVSPGMPPLKLGKTTSFFEFWPSWLTYIPVALQWLALSVRYRSLTLPLIANPQLPLSGMVGIGKSELLQQASGELEHTILPWFAVEKTELPLATQVAAIKDQIDAAGFTYPLVCKPDIGCRGVGVKLIKNDNELMVNFNLYPASSKMVVQKLADFEPEAGIFFTRNPDESQGKIISLALKYTPYVIGDGRKTLAELIASDERAGTLTHLYQSRHKANWHNVIPAGEPYRLVFSASHSKGAIFRDANNLITEQLNAKLTSLMSDLPDFHYGRLDVKFKDVESLGKGENIQIVEINTASSEPLHIWDSNTSLRSAMSALLYQYKLLFQYGDANRTRGFKPPSIRKLIRHWRLEQKLSSYYAETD